VPADCAANRERREPEARDRERNSLSGLADYLSEAHLSERVGFARGGDMNKEFHICGLGNSLVDVFLDLSDDEFAALELERGTMRLVERPEQQKLLERFHDREPRLVSGGSVANSIIAFSQLGGNAAFIGCVGDDRYGLFYQREFEQLRIDIGNPAIVDEATGTCLCVITPDAERTMRTCLAVSSHLAARHVDEERIKKSQWLFIEGYVFANPKTGQEAIRRALEVAKANGVKVAITCSEAFVVNVFGDAFFAALKQVDLLFCNGSEACAVAKTETATEAFAQLKNLVPNVVVTDGPHGAYVRFGGSESFVPAFACEPKDLTGAGDMFAGAFLYGVTHGVPPAKAARAACYLSMKVITQVGARLHHGTREFWDDALSRG
jgi:sugar/nucleoside kinase (ribokinase family)